MIFYRDIILGGMWGLQVFGVLPKGHQKDTTMRPYWNSSWPGDQTALLGSQTEGKLVSYLLLQQKDVIAIEVVTTKINWKPLGLFSSETIHAWLVVTVADACHGWLLQRIELTYCFIVANSTRPLTWTWKWQSVIAQRDFPLSIDLSRELKLKKQEKWKTTQRGLVIIILNVISLQFLQSLIYNRRGNESVFVNW